ARARGAGAGATPTRDADAGAQASDAGANAPRAHDAAGAGGGAARPESPGFQPGAGRFFARLADPRAAVDVGGIAKGWIADELSALLATRGLGGFIVNLGGNVAVGGAKPDGAPWRVGIRDPRAPHDPDALLGAVPLAAGSAVTSGVYERSFTGTDGRLRHHVLDPRTGWPVATDVAGVTVVADRSLDAEGFSTTLLALGLERGLALARRHAEIRQAFFVGFDGQVTPAR
ncbi:FAD:protein FMN transferase, partial [Enterorhabdus sp. P55]|uniref:FAD:protein FMN transferase n=1 Tax=Enterorhabdus sp. P55 TaxID=2304571 RepID=UPI00136D65D6